MLSPDDSEELRGSKCMEWAQEAWGYADKQCSKWKQLPAQPVNPHVHDEPIYMWLEQRGLHWRPGLTAEDIWYEPHHTYPEDGKELIVFTRLPCSPDKAERIRKARSLVDGHRIAFHGTISYATPNIAANQFIASDNKDRGHRTLGSDTGEDLTGVYVTPIEDTAVGYATPQIMFRNYDAGGGDQGQYWTRFVFEVLVDVNKRLGKNKPGQNKNNIQWVFSENHVEVVSLRVYTNFPPGSGDGRIRAWKPELELTPGPSYAWCQIKKLNGRWVNHPVVAPEPEAIPAPSESPMIRKKYWPENDKLKKYPCTRCGHEETAFDDPDDKRFLVCCNPAGTCKKKMIHPFFQKTARQAMQRLASGSNSQVSEPSSRATSPDSIVDSRRGAKHSSGYDSEKRGKGVGLSQPNTPEDYEDAKSSGKPSKPSQSSSSS